VLGVRGIHGESIAKLSARLCVKTGIESAKYSDAEIWGAVQVGDGTVFKYRLKYGANNKVQ
jgi:hypothetical protein